jgi:hypothetical protein
MKSTGITKGTEQAIEIALAATDRMLEEYILPLTDFGNPENLLGKVYDEWTPQDIGQLSQIYGTGSESVLATFIARKEIEKMLGLEAQVKQLEGEG